MEMGLWVEKLEVAQINPVLARRLQNLGGRQAQYIYSRAKIRELQPQANKGTKVRQDPPNQSFLRPGPSGWRRIQRITAPATAISPVLPSETGASKKRRR
jgi:hypothetical protein